MSESMKDNAFSREKNASLTIGKTVYLITAHYAESNTLYDKLLRLMKKALDNAESQGE